MLTGVKKEDAEVQKQGKKKAQIARAMYSCELLNLFHGNGTKREESTVVFYSYQLLVTAFHMIFNKACRWLSHVRRPSAGF